MLLDMMDDGKNKKALADVLTEAHAREKDQEKFSHPQIAKSLYEDYITMIKGIAANSSIPFAELLLGIVEPPDEVRIKTCEDMDAGREPTLLVEYERIFFYERSIEQMVALLNKHAPALKFSELHGGMDEAKIHKLLNSFDGTKKGGQIRAAQLTKQKKDRHQKIKEEGEKIPEGTPKHKVNKIIAKATGLETNYVREARSEIDREESKK